MDSAAFKLIEQYDVIEILSKDGGLRKGSVLKDSDNRVLVSGIYRTIFGREKGFYQTVGPKDVIRIVKSYNSPGADNDNSEAIRLKVKAANELLEDIHDLA